MAPALIVSIVIAIFAVVTQLLNVTSAASLSTTQMLTVWLVAIGLIALVWITYIISGSRPVSDDAGEALAAVQRELDEARRDAAQQRQRADEALADLEQDAAQQRELAEKAIARAEEAEAAAKKAEAEAKKAHEEFMEIREGLNEALVARAHLEQELKAARIDIDRLRNGAPDRIDAGDEDAWVPPEEYRFVDGADHPVRTENIFPGSCYLEPHSIGLVEDKLTGQLVYQCRIVDLNPELKNKPHETVVEILAPVQPPLPPMPRFGWVAFDGLTITGYVIDQTPMRIRYLLRAKSIHPAAEPAKRPEGEWTAAAEAAKIVHFGRPD